MIVVEARANSRMRGLTSQESVTYRSGAISWISSRTRRSWAPFLNDHSRQTAIASTPCSTRVRATLRTSSSSRGTRTVPAWSIRSVTSSARYFGISGAGLRCRSVSWISWAERPRVRPSAFMM